MIHRAEQSWLDWDMAKAAIASVQLARFDRLREPGSLPEAPAPGTVFCNVAADTRAAGTEPPTQQAFTFLMAEQETLADLCGIALGVAGSRSSHLGSDSSLCAGACWRLPVFGASKGQEKGNLLPVDF